MNYDHGFHAGNFADVLKHAVLADLVSRLVRSGADVTVIDSHAGAGWYDLSSPAALRGGEFRQGVQRVYGRPASPNVLLPYQAALKAANPEGALLRYPGSPLIALHHLRARGDRLVAIERNPSVYRLLSSTLSGERRARAVQGDGFAEAVRQCAGITGGLLVMIDPPFESPADFSRASACVTAARAQAPQGIFIIWMPDKGGKETLQTARAVAESDGRGSQTHLMRLWVRAPGTGSALGATALVIAGAPAAFIADWTSDLPALAHLLRQGEGFGASLEAVTSAGSRAPAGPGPQPRSGQAAPAPRPTQRPQGKEPGSNRPRRAR